MTPSQMDAIVQVGYVAVFTLAAATSMVFAVCRGWSPVDVMAACACIAAAKYLGT